jgi:hypothetical protein
MSAACDLFSGLAERQMLIEGRTTCLRTGGAGPPIGKDPVGYVDHTLSSWAKSRDLSPFSPAALGYYRRPLAALERLHAVCKDYRAGASIERRLDEAGSRHRRGAQDRPPDVRAVGEPLFDQQLACQLAGLVRELVGRGGRWPPLSRRRNPPCHPCRAHPLPAIAGAPHMTGTSRAMKVRAKAARSLGAIPGAARSKRRAQAVAGYPLFGHGEETRAGP